MKTEFLSVNIERNTQRGISLTEQMLKETLFDVHMSTEGQSVSNRKLVQ